MSAADHYFSPAAAETGPQRSLEVRLAGRSLDLRTADGVFSHSRLDRGTKVLLDCVPPPPADARLLDLGCGWGPIALTAAILAPQAEIWATDVNPRARALTTANAVAAGLHNIHVAEPEKIPHNCGFTHIWSNPAIRIGKSALQEMLVQWLRSLRPGGVAYLVVQKNLGSDSLHRWLAEHPAQWAVDRWHSASGFRVLRVTRPPGPSGTAPAR